MIILDTNVVSELTRLSPNPAVLLWVDNQEREELYITVITIAELCFGVARLPDLPARQRVSQDNEAIINSDFAGRILTLDEAAAREYADMMAYHRANKLSVDRHDCMIAAIARVNGGEVATRNIRDFRHCGVSIINPWEPAGA